MTLATVCTSFAFWVFFETPFDNILNNLQSFFTGTLAKVLTVVAIVIAGLTYSYSKNGGSERLKNVAIGAAVAMFAGDILAWWTK
jgi:type IV secretion system protein VirB2